MHKKFWSENLKETDHLEGLSVDGWIILEWVGRRAVSGSG
jgi:hypothetical protein